MNEAALTDAFELPFRAEYALSESGEVALEDYARVLTNAREADALRSRNDPALVRGVRLREAAATLTAALVHDIEDFAQGLAQDRGNGGLGWS